jgi:hypothetical protein
MVGNYFAKGDTQVFQTIKFDFQTPTKEDKSIIQFIQHVEKQKAIAWRTWEAALPEAQGQSGSDKADLTPQPSSLAGEGQGSREAEENSYSVLSPQSSALSPLSLTTEAR